MSNPVELKTESAEEKFQKLGFNFCVVVSLSELPSLERLRSFAVLGDAFVCGETADQYLVRFGKGEQEACDEASLQKAIDRFSK